MLIYKKQRIFLLISLIVILPFFLHSPFPDLFKFSAKLMVSAYNIASKWHYEFQYINGEVQDWYTTKSDNAQLIYLVNLERSTTEFQLYNLTSHFINFLESSTTYTISGFFSKDEKYTVFVNARQVTNGNFRSEMKCKNHIYP